MLHGYRSECVHDIDKHLHIGYVTRVYAYASSIICASVCSIPRSSSRGLYSRRSLVVMCMCCCCSSMCCCCCVVTWSVIFKFRRYSWRKLAHDENAVMIGRHIGAGRWRPMNSRWRRRPWWRRRAEAMVLTRQQGMTSQTSTNNNGNSIAIAYRIPLPHGSCTRVLVLRRIDVYSCCLSCPLLLTIYNIVPIDALLVVEIVVHSHSTYLVDHADDV